MSAMHHDTSADLKVVGNKLKDILEVRYNLSLVWNFNCCLNMVFPINFNSA